MAYDIHGEKLALGHCEVHPWINQEYPCCQCTEEVRKSEGTDNYSLLQRIAKLEKEFADIKKEPK